MMTSKVDGEKNKGKGVGLKSPQQVSAGATASYGKDGSKIFLGEEVYDARLPMKMKFSRCRPWGEGAIEIATSDYFLRARGATAPCFPLL